MLCPWCHADNADGRSTCTACGRSAAALHPGSILAGRYEILEVLGRGGMGLVYKARDVALDEVVALKVLRPDAVDADGSRRFRAEIRLARRVTHRNVCRIHEYGEDGPWRFISMAFVDGTDLRHDIRERGALPVPEAFSVSIAVARAIAAVHEEGIVHRDLKTTNIMRDARGQVKVMDFGIAKSLDVESTGSTATGLIMGTPEYMSPEQARGEKVDFRTDLYALGVVVFELFTGDVPFHADTPMGLLFKVVGEPPPLEGPAVARVPAAVIPVLRRALAKDPSQRYASAEEMAAALEAARTAVLPAHVPTPWPTPIRPRAAAVRPPPGRRRAAWAAAAGAVLVLGGGAAILASVFTQRGFMVTTAPLATLARASTAVTLPPPTPMPAAPSPLPSTPPSEEPAPAPTAPPAVSVAEPVPRRPPEIRRPAFDVPSRHPTVAPLTAPIPPASSTATTGVLRVLVIPWGEVTVDGVRVTPGARLSLAAGRHAVTVANPAYELVQRQVRVKAGEASTVVVDLPEDAVRRKP